MVLMVLMVLMVPDGSDGPLGALMVLMVFISGSSLEEKVERKRTKSFSDLMFTEREMAACSPRAVSPVHVGVASVASAPESHLSTTTIAP